MPARNLPSFAAWRHRDAREGFEVVFARCELDGHRFEGSTAAVENAQAWTVDYVIALSAGWSTARAHVSARSTAGETQLQLDGDMAGRWRVNGAPVPYLEGCLDVDLESSALTNAFPVQRLRLEIGQAADAPAVHVRAGDLRVERLEQRYMRLEDDRGRRRYHYTAPRFEFECEVVYDDFGLVLDYPGIARRVA